MKDNGYYHCEKCKLYIKVLTSMRYRDKDGRNEKFIKAKIPNCPHCKGLINPIGENVYKQVNAQLYLNVGRTYHFERRGEISINMDLRFT